MAWWLPKSRTARRRLMILAAVAPVLALAVGLSLYAMRGSVSLFLVPSQALQEKNLLVRFYKEFFAHHKEDPTGYRTLERVLGEKDMAAFQKSWEKYVLSLRAPS